MNGFAAQGPGLRRAERSGTNRCVDAPLGARLGLLAITALVGACAQDPVLLAAPPQGARSAVLLVEEDQRVEVAAADVTAPTALPFHREGTGRLVVLFFAHTLDELQLAPGLVRLAAEPERARPLPEDALLIEEAITDASGAGPLEVVAALDPALRQRVLLPPLDTQVCVAQGGCADRNDGFTVCTIPCPELSAPIAPAPPAPPEPPRLGAAGCPSGWRAETTSAGLSLCAPPIRDATATCGPGEGAFLEGCARVGSPCPAQDFAEGLPASGVAYVHPILGDDRNDGSASRPWASLSFAAANAAAGSTIALAKGRYLEAVTVGSDHALVGACPESTVIEAVVRIPPGGRATLRDLSVVTASAAIVSGPGTALHLDGVSARSTWDIAVNVDAGGVLDGQRVELRGGRYALVVSAARVELSEVVLRSTVDATLYTRAPGAAISLHRGVLLRDPSAPQAMPYAVAVNGATMTLREMYLRGGSIVDTSSITVSDLWIDAESTIGLVARDTSGEIDRIVVRGGARGFQVARGGTSLRARDVALLEGDPAIGAALDVSVGAHLEVDRGWLERVGRNGVIVAGLGTTLSLRDFSLLGTTTSEPTVPTGSGLSSCDDSRVTIERGLLRDVLFQGVHACRRGRVEANDLEVAGSLALVAASPAGGHAIVVSNQGTMHLTRLRTAGCGSACLRLDDDATEVIIEDLDLHGAQLAASATNRSHLLVERATVSDLADDGLVSGSGAWISFRDASLRSGVASPHGAGARAAGDSRITLSHFVLEDFRDGVLIEAGQVELDQGHVRRNQVGARVLSAGASLTALIDRVHFTDNQTDIVAQSAR